MRKYQLSRAPAAPRAGFSPISNPECVVQSAAGKVSYHSDLLPEVTPMLTNKRSFPALDEWTRMSEQQQT